MNQNAQVGRCNDSVPEKSRERPTMTLMGSTGASLETAFRIAYVFRVPLEEVFHYTPPAKRRR
jgi:DNA-binding XRE family transcriptional regulator